MRALTSFLFAAMLGSGLAAQDATLTVIHGIPDLPKPVDVFANNAKLFSFDFNQSKGPLALKAGTYKIEVKLDNKTVLMASPTLTAGTSYTAIAHLKEKGGIQLSLYVNDLKPIAKGKSRLVVRHTAQAPAVNVQVKTSWWSWRYTNLIKGLANPKEAGADVDSRSYYVALAAASNGKRAFGPVRLTLKENRFYSVFAIGQLGQKSFRLFVQDIDRNGPVSLTGMVRGKACGGAIAISTKTPEFGKAFQVSMTGGTKDGLGLLHIGTSDSRLFLFRLPLRLDFLGATGCTLYQNTPMVMSVKLDSKGAVSKDIKIPASMSRSFKELHYQYSFFAPKSNRLGLLLTDYASVERK